jgi:cytochrome c peroxidase
VTQNAARTKRLAPFPGLILWLLAALALAAVLTGPVAAQSEPSNPPPFVEVTAAAGIQAPRVGNERITGQAWADYDGDGWLDLYITDFGTPQKPGVNRLYRNNGDGTFSLSPLAEQVALAEAKSGGAVWADYNNDGWSDLYVTNWGANTLFRNDGGQGFTDVTVAAGVGDIANGKTASWGDFDSDGFLDLYVANWSCTPSCGRPVTGDQDRLYRSNGDGTFSDMTRMLSSQTAGAGFIAGFVDFDNDGDLDIYLVNDEFVNPVGNALWRNDGPGCDGWCFTEVSKEAGANQRVMGMGLGIGDINNDLHFDLFFTNVGPSTLLLNQGDGTFVNGAVEAGVNTPKAIGWGTVIFDFDNDGWQDIYLAQMTRTDGGVGFNPLFRNNGDGTFTDLAEGSGVGDPGKSIGVSVADFDRDGYLDLIVGNFDEGYRLYRNTLGDSALGGNWFALNLSGDGPVNRDAVGARVFLTGSDDLVQMRQVTNSTGLGGNSALELHFGLGTAEVESVRVVWLDGHEEVFDGLATNARYTLAYGGEPVLVDGLARATIILPDWWTWAVGGLAAIVLAGGMILIAWHRGTARSNRQPVLRPRRAPVGLATGYLLILLVIAGTAAWLWSSRDLLAERFNGRTPDGRLALLLSKSGVTPLDLGPMPDPALVRLGEALFFDKELSGNRDISCATCHHPQLAGSDGLPLSFGTGGHGLGPAREPGSDQEIIPRNASELFNRGSPVWNTMFWDGRVNFSDVYNLDTPVGNGLPDMLQTVLSAQGMFPVTSRDEMRGQLGDTTAANEINELAAISDMEPKKIWSALMRRLLAIPGYVELFQAAYPDVRVEDLGFEHAAHALAAYEIAAFSFDDSPWDRYLAGDLEALDDDAMRGALLFYGEAGCGTCHSGSLLTDQQFHNIGVPQIGPGKLDVEKQLDLGRFLETGKPEDRYTFRTPPLRNVALTAPYMHNGAFATLEAAVRHHLDATSGLRNYDPAQLPEYFRHGLHTDPAVYDDILQTLDPRLAEPTLLTDVQVSELLAFLHALTSPAAVDLAHLVPDSVPSGLPVED